jgi:hypothetical protein
MVLVIPWCSTKLHHVFALGSSHIDEEKINVRAGSMIIWDSRLPHANYPNESRTDFRYVQYITYYPADYESEKKKRNRKEDAQIIFQQIKNKSNGFVLNSKQLQNIGAY